MDQLKPWHFIVFLLLLFTGFCFVVPDSGYDKYFWISWTKDIADKGIGNIYYNKEVNNFPLVMYLLKAYTLFFSSDFIDVFSINYLKCMTIIFDLSTLLLIVFFIRQKNKNIGLLFLFLLNPAFWYNTVIWGQVDSVYTFFVFISVFFAVNSKSLPALVFILLAVNTKLQAIIFLPVIALLIFPLLKNEKLRPIYMLVVLMGLQILILLPFILSGSIQQTISSLRNSSLDFYPTLSRNAYNLWYLVFADPVNTSDQLTFLLPLKFWGIILFGLFYSVIIFLFLKREKGGRSMEMTFLVLTLVSLGFFFFNTQMHERYVHPVILFSGLYAVFSKRYLIFVLCSVAYLLNLEAVMQILSYFDDEVFGFVIRYKTWIIFNPVVISLMYLVSISAGIIDLQRNIHLSPRPDGKHH